jgi:hypothetical protein
MTQRRLESRWGVALTSHVQRQQARERPESRDRKGTPQRDGLGYGLIIPVLREERVGRGPTVARRHQADEGSAMPERMLLEQGAIGV